MDEEAPEPSHPARKLRVLALVNGPTPDAVLGTDQRELGALHELTGLPEADTEVKVLRNASLDALAEAAQAWRPTLLYATAGTAAPKEELQDAALQPLPQLCNEQGAPDAAAERRFVEACAGLELEGAFLDFAGGAAAGEALLQAGAARAVVAWPAAPPPPALPALDFAHCFFGLLRDPHTSVPEAYVVAAHFTRAHATQPPPPGAPADAPASEPHLPSLLGAAPPPPLPNNGSVPPLEAEGVDLSGGVAAAFPGYDALRLLAPNAELRLLHAGIAPMVNPHTMRFLGESLRALLAAQVRRLQVTAVSSAERPPSHMPAGSAAIRCDVRSAGGARCTVTLGGPAALLKNKDLVEHALRQALTADAQTLQLKLPPPGAALPPARAAPAVAAGAPVVEALAATSVWCVQLLKALAQEPSCRVLVLLGLASVSAAPVTGWSPQDAERITAVVTQNDPDKAQALGPQLPTIGGRAGSGSASDALRGQDAKPPRPPRPSASPSLGAPAEGGGGHGAGLRSAGPSGVAAGGSMSPAGSGGVAELAAAAAAASQQQRRQGQAELMEQQRQALEQQVAAGGEPAPWKSSRPPLAFCSEEQFYSDLIAFLTERQGRQIDPKTFPEAILNGGRLDLFNLYREVCSRGGFKVGNGINWKGQVFPRMRNFTAGHRMTGVGNALKRHYQLFLLDYEQAHAEDVTGDRCGICGRGDEHASDWISCDSCDCWVHFSCDARHTRGTFKEFAKGRGRVYHCPRCSHVRQQQALQAQAATQAAVAAQVAAAMQRLQGRQATEPMGDEGQTPELQQQQQQPATVEVPAAGEPGDGLAPMES